MANKKHLAILKQGMKVWNKWRGEHLRVRPDLEDANLNGVDLIRAHLDGAKLNGADLNGAKLRGADLSSADLIGANLDGATLSGADFSGAKLSGADLSGVNFSGADLIGADLYTAIFGSTVFFDTNLSDATGLDTCQHRGPSTIDHRTLAKSGGLPQAFLQGCGLPDWLIEAYKLTQEELTDHRYHLPHLRTSRPRLPPVPFLLHQLLQQERRLRPAAPRLFARQRG